MNWRSRWLSMVPMCLLLGCGESGPDAGQDALDARETEPALGPAVAAERVQIEPGLSMRILMEGDGEPARSGQVAVVHYTGWLFDETAENGRGRKFDSSLDRDEYFSFMLGAGRVIRGWDQGVVGMKIGEKRELVIAPELAYGDHARGDVIGPGATLVFEVELVALQNP